MCIRWFHWIVYHFVSNLSCWCISYFIQLIGTAAGTEATAARARPIEDLVAVRENVDIDSLRCITRRLHKMGEIEILWLVLDGNCFVVEYYGNQLNHKHPTVTELIFDHKRLVNNSSCVCALNSYRQYSNGLVDLLLSFRCALSKFESSCQMPDDTLCNMRLLSIAIAGFLLDCGVQWFQRYSICNFRSLYECVHMESVDIVPLTQWQCALSTITHSL